MRINAERLKKHIDELGKIGVTEKGGISRFSLTPEDIDARRLIIEWMKEAGLEVRVDQAANIIGKRAGKVTSPSIMTGSHIDTVPDGGRFDGVFGTLAAIEITQTLNDYGIKTEHPVEAVVFTNEEGVRFPLFIGSKTIAGELGVETLYSIKDKDGVTFLEALKKAGYDLKKLAPAKRASGEIKAFIEAHIEQGPVLEAKKIPIGVVDKIAGISHTYVTIEGQAGHAGTTPMSMRRNPLLAAAKIILAVDETVKALSDVTVGTVGFLKVLPGATNVVPGYVQMGIDIRDVDYERMETALSIVKRRIAEICSSLKLSYTLDEKSKVPPTLLSNNIVKTIIKASERLGLQYNVMPSGAGHDTMPIAKIAECAMIFVPSKNGKSHVPDELTELEDLERGANVLLQSIAELAVAM